MDFSTMRSGEVDIVTLRGGVHAQDNDEFSSALAELAERQRPLVVMDARELGYVNSRAVGALAEFSRRARLAGGRLVLVAPGPTVSKILQAVGLLSFVPTYATLEEALKGCQA